MRNLKKLRRKLNRVNQKIAKLKAGFPEIDFTKTSHGMAWREYFEMMNDKIYLEVDVKFCESENRRELCTGCDCWKIAAAKHEGRI